MTGGIGLLVAILVGVCLYLALPAAMIWGWIRWLRPTQPRTLFSILSLAGFVLSTASGLLAISAMLCARAIGGFPFYSPPLLRIYAWGALLSTAATALGAVGVLRPSPLRWHALACGLGTLLFWLVSAAGE